MIIYKGLFLAANAVKDLSPILYGIIQSGTIVYTSVDDGEKGWGLAWGVFLVFLMIMYVSKAICQYSLEMIKCAI